MGGHTDINGGYFIFSFKDSKMKIVNISPAQQKIINVIIKRHCRVTREGWKHGRSMTYFFKESQRKILKIVIFEVFLLFWLSQSAELKIIGSWPGGEDGQVRVDQAGH